MPDPGVGAGAGAWPPPYSQAFYEQASALLDERPVLVIVGPHGSSRDALAAGVAERVTTGGASPVVHTPRYGDRHRPYSTLLSLFPDLRIAPGASRAEVEAAARAVIGDARYAPLVLVLTDADLCDPESLAMLAHLAQTASIRLIVTLTPETRAHHEPLASVAEVVDIPPLDHEQIAALLRERFGVRPHPLLVSLLAERTGGAYSALRDVADASSEAGQIFTVENVLAPRPGVTADDLASRQTPHSVERLGGGAELTALVELTALLDQLDVDEARDCVGSDLVDLALTHGIFAIRDGSIVLASPAETVLVRRAMDDARRGELFEAYAEKLPRTLTRAGVAVRAADWWIAADRLLPAELAVRAAREANLTGRHRQAVAFTDPANNDHHAPIAFLERAFALAELSADAELRELYAQLDPATLTEEELLVYLRGMARIEDSADRRRLVERATSDDDPDVRRRRIAVRTLAELVDRAFDAAGDETINKLRSLAFSAQLSPCNRAVTFATLSAVLRHSGRPLQAVDAAEFALDLLTGEDDALSAFHLSLAREVHIMALISAVDPEGAESAISEYTSGACAHPVRSPMMLALETSLAMTQGDLERALASARLCLASLQPNDPHQVGGWVEAMLTQILVLRSRPDDARSALFQAEARPARRRQLDLERRMMLAWTHDALADPEEALRVLAETAEEARAHGFSLALIEAAALSVQIGGPPHLPMLLGAVDDLVDPSGVPLVWQTFARSAHRGDLQSLIALADLADNSGARRFAAEVAQYILDTWRRRTDMSTESRIRLEVLAASVSDPEDRALT